MAMMFRGAGGGRGGSSRKDQFWWMDSIATRCIGHIVLGERLSLGCK